MKTRKWGNLKVSKQTHFPMSHSVSLVEERDQVHSMDTAQKVVCVLATDETTSSFPNDVLYPRI
jgi:hypothetical protein